MKRDEWVGVRLLQFPGLVLKRWHKPWDFCQQLPRPKLQQRIFSPSRLNFRLANLALSRRVYGEMEKYSQSQSQLPFSHLLPSGETVLQLWQIPWHQGCRTFKWKIGVASIEEELKVFNQLIQSLPTSAKLRLDANGGLTPEEAHQWLRVTDSAGIVEFLEQPLPPEQFDTMLEMSTQYSTPIALDESVATLNQLEDCYQRGWRGIYIIKAAIAGSPRRLRDFCQQHEIDVVFSSVLESAIARQSALQLAAELSNPNRAVGFGVNHWFNEDDETWLKHLWNNL
jgi:O-succinylbenzoate synthase